eukprot:359138-Chlamydomonas_euryale.AAC.4
MASPVRKAPTRPGGYGMRSHPPRTPARLHPGDALDRPAYPSSASCPRRPIMRRRRSCVRRRRRRRLPHVPHLVHLRELPLPELAHHDPTAVVQRAAARRRQPRALLQQRGRHAGGRADERATVSAGSPLPDCAAESRRPGTNETAAALEFSAALRAGMSVRKRRVARRDARPRKPGDARRRAPRGLKQAGRKDRLGSGRRSHWPSRRRSCRASFLSATPGLAWRISWVGCHARWHRRKLLAVPREPDAASRERCVVAATTPASRGAEKHPGCSVSTRRTCM